MRRATVGTPTGVIERSVAYRVAGHHRLHVYGAAPLARPGQGHSLDGKGREELAVEVATRLHNPSGRHRREQLWLPLGPGIAQLRRPGPDQAGLARHTAARNVVRLRRARSRPWVGHARTRGRGASGRSRFHRMCPPSLRQPRLHNRPHRPGGRRPVACVGGSGSRGGRRLGGAGTAPPLCSPGRHSWPGSNATTAGWTAS